MRDHHVKELSVQGIAFSLFNGRSDRLAACREGIQCASRYSIGCNCKHYVNIRSLYKGANGTPVCEHRGLVIYGHPAINARVLPDERLRPMRTDHVDRSVRYGGGEPRQQWRCYDIVTDCVRPDDQDVPNGFRPDDGRSVGTSEGRTGHESIECSAETVPGRCRLRRFYLRTC